MPVSVPVASGEVVRADAAKAVARGVIFVVVVIVVVGVMVRAAAAVVGGSASAYVAWSVAVLSGVSVMFVSAVTITTKCTGDQLQLQGRPMCCA